MADLRVETIPPPWDGWDTDTSPGRVPLTRSPVVRDLLTDHPGMVRQRGPIIFAGYAETGTTDDAAMIGYIARGETALGFQRDTTVNTSTTAPGGYLEPQVLPLTSGGGGYLAGCSTNVWLNTGLTPLNGTNEPTAYSNPSARGGRAELATSLGSNIYVPGISANVSDPATLAANGAEVSTAPILRWDGGDTLPSTGLTAITVQAKGALAVRSHLSRLFALGGLDIINGGTQVELNSLYWTDPSASDLTLTASWKNATSGLANKIVVDSDRPDDFGVALAKVGTYLCILKRHSIHMLYGLTSDTFSIRTISNGIGCMDARSVVEYEGGIFFMSEQGYMHFDGSKIDNVSTSIQSRLMPDVFNMVGATGDYGDTRGLYIRETGIPVGAKPGGFVIAERLPSNTIMLVVGSYVIPPATGLTEYSKRFWGVYDVDRQTWQEVSTDPSVVSPCPISFYSTQSRVGFLDKVHAYDLEKFTSPERQGSTTSYAPGGIDVGAGTLPIHAGNSMFGAAIPSKVVSRWFKLGTPGQRAQGHRALIDYRLVTADSGVDGAWTIHVEDQDGNNLTGNLLLPVTTGTDTDRTRYEQRSRYAVEFFSEANEVRIVAEWLPSQPFETIVALELHDVSIEYQSARPRTSTA